MDDGEPRYVSGVTNKTTCDDIIKALIDDELSNGKDNDDDGNYCGNNPKGKSIIYFYSRSCRDCSFSSSIHHNLAFYLFMLLIYNYFCFFFVPLFPFSFHFSFLLFPYGGKTRWRPEEYSGGSIA